MIPQVLDTCNCRQTCQTLYIRILYDTMKEREIFIEKIQTKLDYPAPRSHDVFNVRPSLRVAIKQPRYRSLDGGGYQKAKAQR